MGDVRWIVEEFDVLDSTNTWLVGRAREGAAEGLVARADYQTAGRGRRDRTWEASPGSSLLTSILLRPHASDPLYLHTVAVALAARAALVRLCGLRPELKWPNDLVVVDDKLGGVLAELVTSSDGGVGVVVGVGINLTAPGPPGVASTSVRESAGVTLDPRAVLDLLLEELDVRLACWRDGDVGSLVDEFASSLATLGRRVRVERPTGVVEGVAESVDPAGRLCVRDGDAVIVVEVGDVEHLRYAP